MENILEDGQTDICLGFVKKKFPIYKLWESY